MYLIKLLQGIFIQNFDMNIELRVNHKTVQD